MPPLMQFMPKRSIGSDLAITINIPTIKIGIEYCIATVQRIEAEINLPPIDNTVTTTALSQKLCTRPIMIIRIITQWICSKPTTVEITSLVQYRYKPRDNGPNISEAPEPINLSNLIRWRPVIVFLSICVGFLIFNYSVTIHVETISTSERIIEQRSESKKTI